MIKLLDAATANGRSTAYLAPPDDYTAKVLFSGTIGNATISLETSPDAGTTFIATGKTFTSGAVEPAMIEIKRGERLYANQTGIGGGTSSTIWAT